MSNETKQDVFDAAMSLIRSFEETFLDHSSYHGSYTKTKYLCERYAAALPDDLPVIPQTVGEILRSAHGQTNLLGVLDTAKNGYKVSETLAWIIANQNTFARAWILCVWRVEETGEVVKL